MLEALSFFLVRVPEREAEETSRNVRPSPSSRATTRAAWCGRWRTTSRRISPRTGDIGRKYLINHSAGSGKTLSICWLADRLHSLFKPGTNEKLVDIIFILTDRKSLDTNIREDIEKFTHLKDVVGLARKADDLPRFLKERKSIIVTTQQKFAWVLEEIREEPGIEEAARRVPDRRSPPLAGRPDGRGHPRAVPQGGRTGRRRRRRGRTTKSRSPRSSASTTCNQLFVAFTATPAPATVTLFGEPFDTYTEAEAIAEGYIVDVAASIISYKTLYNLHCPIVPKPDEEKLYPKGVVAKALQNVAFQDDGLIQYKAEVMLRIFEKDVKPLIGGRAKAMIVTTSRVAGLRYFNIIKEKLKERGADYKVLYAFSDFVHPGDQRGHQRARRQRVEGRRADRGPLRGRRLPADDRGEQIPDRLRPAAARRHVPRQAGRGSQRRADGLAPEPLP